jgi:hypothetical protein
MEKVKEIKITLKEREGLVVGSTFEQQGFEGSFEITGVLRHFTKVIEQQLLDSNRCVNQNS